MTQDVVNERIASEVEHLLIVDTHEHIAPQEIRNSCDLDFGYLLADYVGDDLVSAGMPPTLCKAVQASARQLTSPSYVSGCIPPPDETPPDREDMSVAERWSAVADYWEATRNTAYAKQVLVAVRDLFGIDDLNESTYVQLSQALADSRRPDWFRHVLREKAKIDVSLVQLETADIDVDHELFRPVMSIGHWVVPRTRRDLAILENEVDLAIHSLDDLVNAMRLAVSSYAENGAVGIKNWLAYYRGSSYEMVTHHEAETVFGRIVAHLGEGPSWHEAKPLQDYLMHQVIRTAVDLRLPLCVHTGFLAGNGNVITNGNPLDLTNLFIEYREQRFVLMHGGYPYVHEWALLVKTFPHVYADLCWLHGVSPEVYRGLLHELIETVPASKVMAFGGDALIVETAYASSRTAREVVARVLSEKVADGYLDEDEAVRLARRFLRDTAVAVFGLASD